MCIGVWGVFFVYYVIEVIKEFEYMVVLVKNSDWVDQFWVKFLGLVQVFYYKGNDVLCVVM